MTERASGDLNVVHAAQLAQVRDRGGPRRGEEQGVLDLIADGAVAIRGGRIVGVGPTESVMVEWGDNSVPTIDASGKIVLPGLVECHSHPLFAGERHQEYAERLAGATVAEVMSRGGGIWSSVVQTRSATHDELLVRAALAYDRILAGGVTTLEVKSGYGLTVDDELAHLRILQESRSLTPMELVVTFLGAHVVPKEADDANAYADLVLDELLPRVVEEELAEFHDITCERGLFTSEQASRMLERSSAVGIPTRTHADAWAPSEGWSTSVAGAAVSAEHLTFTPDEEIRDMGQTDTFAVLLPAAELIYMTDTRANARLFVDNNVPVAIATDYCSSIHATSLVLTIALAAPWFRISPGEAIVGATLNAAYSLHRGHDRGSIDVGKRGDLVILDCEHPNELCLAFGAPLVVGVVTGGHPVHGAAARLA